MQRTLSANGFYHRRNGPSGLDVAQVSYPSGLRYWLDAAVGVSGNNWVDRANGYVFVSPSTLVNAAPLNGNPVIDISDTYLNCPHPAWGFSEMTMLAVTRMATAGADKPLFLTTASDLSTGGPTAYVAQYEYGGDLGTYNGAGQNKSAIHPPAGVYQILEHRAGGGVVRNRSHTPTTTYNGPTEVFSRNMVLQVFSKIGETVGGLWGQPLAEFLVWDRALTDTELASVVAILRAKYIP